MSLEELPRVRRPAVPRDRKGAAPAPSVFARPPSRRGRLPGRLYTRFVALLKVALPALALGIVLLLLAWPRLRETGTPPVLPQAADTLEMNRAHYVGVDEKDRPFSVDAEKAVRSAEAPELVDLVKPEAELTLEDGTWVYLRSDQGRYNEKTGKLVLLGHVDLFQDKGYEFRTDEAHVDMDAGTAWGDRPVQGQGPFGEIFAQGFRLFDKGQTIVFLGQARLNLAPRAGAGANEGGGVVQP